MNKEGIVWVPYVIVTVATSINGETVWYKNKWKNLLLKIKRLFIKPNYLINNKFDYSKKTINKNYYTTIKINE